MESGGGGGSRGAVKKESAEERGENRLKDVFQMATVCFCRPLVVDIDGLGAGSLLEFLPRKCSLESVRPSGPAVCSLSANYDVF